MMGMGGGAAMAAMKAGSEGQAASAVAQGAAASAGGISALKRRVSACHACAYEHEHAWHIIVVGVARVYGMYMSVPCSTLVQYRPHYRAHLIVHCAYIHRL